METLLYAFEFTLRSDPLQVLDEPPILDEKRKHFIIRHLIGEIDWSGTDRLVVDMPQGTGEEVKRLLQLGPYIAVVVTAPQLISESAVRKVVEMASEYKLPPLGFVENQQNGVTGEAGHRLATHYGLTLLPQIPWSPDLSLSMDEHVPFDHQVFLPVAEYLTDRHFPASEVQSPPTSEKDDLLRRPRPGSRVKNWPLQRPTYRPQAYL